MTTLVAEVAAATERVGRALLVERGGPGPRSADRPELWDPALWTAGSVRLGAVLAADGAEHLAAAVEQAAPAERDRAVLAAGLAGPVELLLALGSDDRVVPTAGRSSYRMPLADPAPLLRASSCTATPPDDEALGVARRWRDRLLDAVLVGGVPDPATWHAGVAAPLVERLELEAGWADRVVLSPSGTDVESFLTAVVQGAHGRPVLVVTVGAREAGSGTVQAAGLRAFRGTAPYGVGLRVGEPLPGTDPDQVSVVDVELRDAEGRVRRASDVEAEIEAHVEHAADRDLAVLVHVMAGSKTGLGCPDVGWVRTWRSRTPRLRMVVDAAQLRLSGRELTSYLRAGASVLLTGSKALGAPPFCGAVLLDEAMARDAEALAGSGDGLPAGLARSVSRADLPAALAGLGGGLEPVNTGLMARWHVALDEWQQFVALPRELRRRVTVGLLTGWRDGLSALPGVEVVPPHPGAVPTILSVAVTAPGGGLQGKDGLAEVYERVVEAPGIYIGQPVETVRGRQGVLRLAVGAPTVTRLVRDAERTGGLDRAVADVVGIAVDRFAGAVPAVTRT
jgi:hypothetical protein